MDLSREEIETIQNASLDDATKIVRYLEEEKQQQKSRNRFLLVIAVIGAIGSVIAAITGIIVVLN